MEELEELMTVQTLDAEVFDDVAKTLGWMGRVVLAPGAVLALLCWVLESNKIDWRF